jgi:predicted nucleic acid-binding Zn finger protein
MEKTIVNKNRKSIVKATIEEDDKRAEKGIEIAQHAGVTELTDQVRFYKVGSQSDPNRKYLVKEIYENKKWSYSCSCPDYENFFIKGETKHECKHIIAVQFAKQYGLTLTEVKPSNWRDDLYDF